MSACPLQQPIMSLPCQVICAPEAALSNPINWNSAASSAPTLVAGHGQGLLYNPALPWDVVLPPPQQGWGIHALPTMAHTKCFFSSSSSSLPLGPHGSSDKSAPWLGELREGKVTITTSLCSTPGQDCALRQAFTTMSSQQGGITFFKPALEAPQLYHKPAAELGVLGEPL